MARPTLVSLAHELGVSRQTVSNVINAPHRVRPETRERVEAAIKASGYRPNDAARALRRQRSQAVAIRVRPTIDGINGAVMDRFVHALVQQLTVLGYTVMLIAAVDGRDEVEQLRELFVRGSIDGCVLTDTHAHDQRPAQLAEHGLPLAAFGRPWRCEHESSHLWVDVDGAAGTRAATCHLLASGLTRIGFVGWPEGSESGDDRRAGWAHALREAGLHPADELTIGVEDGTPEGLAAAERLLDRGVEAIVCSSDSLALGAMEAVRRHGLPLVADELPVIGFDDTPVARAVGMSSVHQPVEECAAWIAHALYAQLSDDHQPPTHALVQPQLVTRTALRVG